MRMAALGGIVGVVGFVGAWLGAGSVRSGYSAVDDAISRLAEAGAPNRWIMTAGFLIFGIGVPIYSLALRRALGGPAWIGTVVSGLATIGAAAAPLGSADTAHNVAAVIGYVALASAPLMAWRTFSARGHDRWATVSLLCSLGSAVLLASTSIDAGHGLTQRLGLGVTDAWIVASAWTMWRHGGWGPDGAPG